MRRAAVYAGGFLGPFAGQIPGVVLSEIGDTFEITAAAAAVCLPAYLVPFASLMLISGSLANTLGPSRMLRIAYASFMVASLVCALAPNWGIFLLGCMLAGSSNAFTTPILLATLGRVVEKRRLGTSLGLFSSAQALGQLAGPGFGGLIAVIDWRLAYVALGVVSALLLIVGVPHEPGHGKFRPRILLDGISWPVIRIGVAQFAFGVSVLGMAFLAALQASQAFDSGPAERGLIVMAGGTLALFVAPLAGRAVDRWGAQRVLVIALVAAAVSIGAVPLAGTPWLLAIAWAAAWACAQVGTVASNGAALALPNGSAGISVTQAFKFYGSASSPAVILPIFLVGGAWGFWAATGILAIMAVVLAATRRGRAAAH